MSFLNIMYSSFLGVSRYWAPDLRCVSIPQAVSMQEYSQKLKKESKALLDLFFRLIGCAADKNSSFL